MAHCTGLWVVAPITRAVDDKTAKTLLGDAFKLQLKMDGTYSNVTFICTKADDMPMSEAIDALGLTDEIRQIKDMEKALERQIEEKTVAEESLRTEIAKLEAVSNNIYDDLDTWEGIAERVKSGETVYPPRPSKRKRRVRRRISRKNLMKDDASDGSDLDNEEPPVGGGYGVTLDPEKLLTKETVQLMLESLQASTETYENNYNQCKRDLRNCRKEIATFQCEVARLRSRPLEKCIKGRNDYSAKRIKLDFAAGLKE
jgi:hypothetical protein